MDLGEFESLIPGLVKSYDGSDIDDVDEWVYWAGDVEHAIVYARLFWPEFLEHDGCLFLSDNFTVEEYGTAMEQCTGDRTAVEEFMNHRHVAQLFRDQERQPTREQIVHLGRVLKETWQCKLNRDFPNRAVTVDFSEGERQDFLDYIIAFFQERGAAQGQSADESGGGRGADGREE
jgi:hypothetical protein